MPQTQQTKLALLRDQYLCQWCMHKEGRVRNVFHWITNYGNIMGGGHHIFGRTKVDLSEAIMALCSECHWKVENSRISQKEIVELQQDRLKIELKNKYRQFYKWSLDEN